MAKKLLTKHIFPVLFSLIIITLTAKITFSDTDAQDYINATATIAGSETELVYEDLFHDADSRFWWGAAWGGTSPDILEWGQFHGRQCFKVEWTENVSNGYLRSDWVFREEDWSDYDGLKADIFIDPDNNDNPRIHFEPRNPDFETVIEKISEDAMPTGTWFTHTWNFKDKDYSTVGAFSFHFNLMGNAKARVYLDNLRLLRDDAETPWDNMDNPYSLKWEYDLTSDATNFSNFSGRNEPITHNVVSSTSAGGSIHMIWDNTKGYGNAKIDASGLSLDLSTYTHIRANIKMTSTSNPVKILFGDGSSAPATAAVTLETADTWEEIIFNLSDIEGFNWETVQAVAFLVETDSGDTTGTVYIDDIYFLRYE